MRTVRTVLLAGAVLALAAPAVAATAVAQETTTPTPAGPGCEATSLTVVNDTAGTEFASLTTEGGTTAFEAYQINLSAPDATENAAFGTVATGESFDSGPVAPNEYSLGAIPIEEGGSPNLSLIYSGDITLTCESTTTLSLVEFLSSTTPVAEDDGVAEAEERAEEEANHDDSSDGGSSDGNSSADDSDDADSDADNPDADADDDIQVPTRIETGAGGAA